MNFQSRIALFCCLVACLLTVSIPLIAEATVGGRLNSFEGKFSVEAPVIPEGYSPNSNVLSETANNSGKAEADRLHPEDNSGEAEGGSNRAPDGTNTENSSYEIPKTVFVEDGGNITEMPLDDYITCVVAAEMPYTFNVEALKAQAVAARSYCLYKRQNGSGHEDSDVCTASNHCAAYTTKNELTDKYGSLNANKIWKKVNDAVKATSGEIITYNGKVALALFHSRSWQYTEASENVWGGSYPYLVSVTTPEEDSVTTVSVSRSDLFEAFSLGDSIAASSAEPASLTSTLNSSQRQDKISYLGKTIKGKSLRSKLKLRSTDFSYVKEEDGSYTFTVHGYGHGVGMSQYGANSMANSGKSYIEILTHYYQGVKVEG